MTDKELNYFKQENNEFLVLIRYTKDERVDMFSGYSGMDAYNLVKPLIDNPAIDETRSYVYQQIANILEDSYNTRMSLKEFISLEDKYNNGFN